VCGAPFLFNNFLEVSEFLNAARNLFIEVGGYLPLEMLIFRDRWIETVTIATSTLLIFYLYASGIEFPFYVPDSWPFSTCFLSY